jgi:ketosteroid isomerase-like protein
VSEAENKQILRRIFDELAAGNGLPFRDAMADDFSWTITGTTSWSGTYRGKQRVLSELMAPLFAQFAGRYTNTAERILADGDYVVVECRGRVETKSGKPYNNAYCYVCRLEDGKLRELTEYLDTELVTKALDPPPRSPTGSETVPQNRLP